MLGIRCDGRCIRVFSSDEHSVSLSVSLPEAKLDVRRTFAMEDNQIKLTTLVVPSDGIPKDIEWCEQ